MQTTNKSPRSSDDITTKFFARMAILGLVIFVSGSSAVFVGFRAALNNSALVRQEGFRNDSYLNVDEPFPNYELWDTATKTKGLVSDLLVDGSALFIFMNTHCGACQRMTPQLNKNVSPALEEGIQVVCIYDDADWYAQSEPDSTLVPRNARVMTMDRAEFVDEDGIIATPTLVGVHRTGTVKFIATGFNRAKMTARFISEQLK